MTGNVLGAVYSGSITTRVSWVCQNIQGDVGALAALSPSMFCPPMEFFVVFLFVFLARTFFAIISVSALVHQHCRKFYLCQTCAVVPNMCFVFIMGITLAPSVNELG